MKYIKTWIIITQNNFIKAIKISQKLHAKPFVAPKKFGVKKMKKFQILYILQVTTKYCNKNPPNYYL